MKPNHFLMACGLAAAVSLQACTSTETTTVSGTRTTGSDAASGSTTGSTATGGSSVPSGTVPPSSSSDGMTPGGRPNEQRRVAIANITGKSGTKTSGKATFTEANGRITMLLEVENASPGLHAVHLHEKGDCSDDSAKAAGEHWNPTAMQHGKMDNGMSHSGDIGNITVGSDGKGRIEMTTDLWSVSSDAKKGIVGRSIIVHLRADDFTSQPSGNAGGRIGCGVITYEP